MAERHSGIPWRQGHVLTAKSAQKLGLIHPNGERDDPIVLMVSHDCDLAAPNQTEPHCEVIPGVHIAAVNGAFTNGKNPRKLHLTFSGGSVPVTAEFIAIDKRTVKKEDILQYSPSERVRLTRSEFVVLQSWLAARYRRPSFADEFEARFKQRRLYKKFTEIIAKAGTHILAVFFDVDSGQEIIRGTAEDTYSLGIYLVFNVTEDPAVAELAARDAANEIRSLLEEAFFREGKWENIELRECEAISENVMSLYEARLYKQWQFDYFSLREDPQGETIESTTKRD
jgi:hypothetical protein